MVASLLCFVHLTRTFSKNFLRGQHANMPFIIENEKQNRMSFFDVQIIREDKIFTTSYCCKPTFSQVNTHFDSFLQSTYKFSTAYKFTYRCFWICSSWTKLHTELLFLEQIFMKNLRFKIPKDNIHILKETTLTVEKNPLALVLPYLGSISLQTRTKLNKSSKTYP